MSIITNIKNIYQNASYVGTTDEIVYIDGFGIAIHDGITKGGKVQLFQNNPSKNWIRNGGFDIAQGGTEFLAAPLAGNQQLTIDGWYFLRSGGSTADVRTQGYDETGNTNAERMMRIISTSLGAADSFSIMEQRSYNFYDYAGREFSFDFPIKSNMPKEIAVDVKIILDTGDSADDITVFAGKQWVGTTFDNQQFNCQMPNIPQGLTPGSGAHVRVRIWLEAGSDWDAQTGGIGTYNATVTWFLTNVMMSESRTPVRYTPDAPNERLARVQQYYERVEQHIGIPAAGLTSPNSTLFGTINFQNSKYREPLDSEVSLVTTLNMTTPAVQAGQLSVGHFNVTGQASSAGNASRVTEYICNIEIN